MSRVDHYAPHPLESAWNAADENALVEELQKVKGQRTRRDVREKQVLQILKETRSPRVRNAAAVAAADMRIPKAADLIVALLTRPDTRNARGTLLYALDDMGAKVPLAVLVDIVLHDSYEAREEALRFIADGRAACTGPERQAARRRLEQVPATADEERSRAIEATLAYLSDDD